MASLDAKVTRIDENLGAVNHNVEVVAQRLEAMETDGGAIFDLRNSLTTLDTSLATLDEELSRQGVQIEELNVTRRNFEAFTVALAAALSDIGPEAAVQDARGCAHSGTGCPCRSGCGHACREQHAHCNGGCSVAADAVQAYLFVDSNDDGIMDAEEASLVGATLVLTPAEGESMSAVTTDSGVLFEGLEAGVYTVTVEDALGFELLSGESVDVTVAEGGEGNAVYFSVAAGE